MDVLLIETAPGASAGIAHQFEAAGHRVLRCHDEPRPSLPCRALIDGSRCPLDDGAEVAVVVRTKPLARAMGAETGALCAARAGLPIVVAGRTAMHPYGPRAIEAPGTATAVVAAHHATERHREELEAQIAAGARCPVRLSRKGDVARVIVRSDDPAAAVRAHQAARRVLPDVRTIDVTLR